MKKISENKKYLPLHWRHCEPRVFLRGKAIQLQHQNSAFLTVFWIASPHKKTWGSQ